VIKQGCWRAAPTVLNHSDAVSCSLVQTWNTALLTRDDVCPEDQNLGSPAIYGTWCSWVRTWSSRRFPALPLRLPFLVYRFFASLTVGRNLKFVW
jgi:hypothetical protein